MTEEDKEKLIGYLAMLIMCVWVPLAGVLVISSACIIALVLLLKWIMQ